MTLRERINRAKLRTAIIASCYFSILISGIIARNFFTSLLLRQLAVVTGLVAVGAGIANIFCFYEFHVRCPQCNRYWGQWLVPYDKHFTCWRRCESVALGGGDGGMKV